MSDNQINPNEFNPNLDRITEREVVPNFFSRLPLGKSIENNIEFENTATNDMINSEYKAFDTLNKILQLLPMDLTTIYNFTSISTTYIPSNKLNNKLYIIKKMDENYNKVLYRAIEISTGFDVTSLFNRISAADNNEDPNYRNTVINILTSNDIDQEEAQNNAEDYIIYELINDIPYTASDGILLFWKPQITFVTN